MEATRSARPASVSASSRWTAKTRRMVRVKRAFFCSTMAKPAVLAANLSVQQRAAATRAEATGAMVAAPKRANGRYTAGAISRVVSFLETESTTCCRSLLSSMKALQRPRRSRSAGAAARAPGACPCLCREPVTQVPTAMFLRGFQHRRTRPRHPMLPTAAAAPAVETSSTSSTSSTSKREARTHPGSGAVRIARLSVAHPLDAPHLRDRPSIQAAALAIGTGFVKPPAPDPSPPLTWGWATWLQCEASHLPPQWRSPRAPQQAYSTVFTWEEVGALRRPPPSR